MKNVILLQPLSEFIPDDKEREEFVNMTKFFYGDSVKTLEAVHASEYNDNWYDGYGIKNFIAKDENNHELDFIDFTNEDNKWFINDYLGFYCKEVGFTVKVEYDDLYYFDYMQRFNSPLSNKITHNKSKPEQTLYIDIYK